ncbi:MAG: type II secretion system protein GspF [Planctomycetota bacterium]|nr:MAG: type II secretion system protein GspF [Planctomycetota bacterium]
MPVYEYNALTSTGEPKRGIVDASTPKEAREKLRSRSLFVTDITAVRKGGGKRKGKGEEEDVYAAAVRGGAFDLRRLFVGRARAELVSVTRLLATLLKAGINLVDAINSVIQQVEDKYLGTVLRQIREDIRSGVSFNDSLAQHPELFDPLYVNMVRAGEASGALDSVLSRLADFMQAQARMKGRLTTALAYPAIMAVMGFGVVCFLLAFVVPKIVAVVVKQSGKAALPLPTVVLIRIQDVFLGYWWLGLLVLATLFLLYKAVTSTEAGAMARDTWKLKIPVLGDLFRKQSIARFAHTFATLLRSGVQATECLKILAHVVDNKLLGKVLRETRERILEGTDISTPLKRSRIFPPVVGDMIAIGEESGQLEELLERIAESYDEEVDQASQRVTSMIEPLIIVAMSGVVGFIVLSIILPLVQGFKF